VHGAAEDGSLSTKTSRATLTFDADAARRAVQSFTASQGHVTIRFTRDDKGAARARTKARKRRPRDPPRPSPRAYTGLPCATSKSPLNVKRPSPGDDALRSRSNAAKQVAASSSPQARSPDGKPPDPPAWVLPALARNPPVDRRRGDGYLRAPFMAVRIRLARAGAKKRPFYRIVAADARAPRDGRFLEKLGTYDPNTDPSTVVVDRPRVDYWLGTGARATETVARLLKSSDSPEDVKKA
jgi:small subunit ribosomal protein S16